VLGKFCNVKTLGVDFRARKRWERFEINFELVSEEILEFLENWTFRVIQFHAYVLAFQQWAEIVERCAT
jgi:hypothetical protein